MEDKPNIIGEKWRDSNGQFIEGHPPTSTGRPKGSISLLTDIKQRLIKLAKEEPDKYQELIDSYWQDVKLRQFLLEMIDGKAKQPVEMSGSIDTRLEVLTRMGLVDDSEIKRIEEQTSKDS